jgi:hypothetical protein
MSPRISGSAHSLASRVQPPRTGRSAPKRGCVSPATLESRTGRSEGRFGPLLKKLGVAPVRVRTSAISPSRPRPLPRARTPLVRTRPSQLRPRFFHNFTFCPPASPGLKGRNKSARGRAERRQPRSAAPGQQPAHPRALQGRNKWRSPFFIQSCDDDNPSALTGLTKPTHPQTRGGACGSAAPLCPGLSCRCPVGAESVAYHH